MAQTQVTSRINNISHSTEIRSAIDLLLSSDSVEVTEPTVKLTECSPNLEVVVNKRGGICTRCNIMFKSRPFLMGHLERCLGNNMIDMKYNDPISYNNIARLEIVDQSNNIQPKLVVVPQ